MSCRIFIYCLPVILAVSCAKQLDCREYIAYFEKNIQKYTSTVEKNGVQATFGYYPPELYTAREALFDTTLAVSNILKKYEKSLFISLTIKHSAQNNAATNNSIISDPHNKKKNLFLIDGRDTIYCTEYNYEPGRTSGCGETFIYAFDRKKIGNLNRYTITIRDISSHLGTLDVALGDLTRFNLKLRG